MKFSLSSFFFTALLFPSTEVKGACTWEQVAGEATLNAGYAGGITTLFPTLEIAQAKCLELGPDECKAVNCGSNPVGCDVRTSDITSIWNGANTYKPPSSDCVDLKDRWNIGAVTASSVGSTYNFQYADMSRLWLGVDTAVKIKATIYGEFCKVDEFDTDTCVWTPQAGMKSDADVSDLTDLSSYADEDNFKFTLVEAQVRCLALGEALCKAVTCLGVDNGLCQVRATASFIAGVAAVTAVTADPTETPPIVGVDGVVGDTVYEVPVVHVWTTETGEYGTEFANNDETEYSLAEAQAACLLLTTSVCKAVSCDNSVGSPGTKCTVRGTGTSDGTTGWESHVPSLDTKCALTPAPLDTVGTDRAFTANSLTWTTDLIDVTTGATTTSTNPLLQYSLTGSPQKMEQSTTPEYGAVPTLKFCVRLGLYPPALHTEANEINFYESIVTITISMNGSFEVLGIGVAPKEQGASTAAQEYTASAELCGDTGNNPADFGQAETDDDGNFNQGAAIKVCIELDSQAKIDGVLMNNVLSFNWNQEGSGSETQVGIDGDGEAGNGLTIMDTIVNGDIVAVPVGTPNVIVTSVLFAKFYEETGSVRASGEVAMGFPGGRRLRNTDNRNLQEADPVAAFDVAATLNKADDGPVAIQQTAGGNGGTYSISNVVGVAITSIVGLLVSNTVLLA